MKKIYLYSRVLSFLLIFLNMAKVNGQSSPTAQTLPYSQIFSIAATSAVYPAGVQGWSVGSAASGSFRTTSPLANSALIASSTAAVTTAGVHNYNGKIGILPGGTLDPSLAIAINTIGFSNVQVNFQAMTIRNPFDGSGNTAISGLDLQFITGSISGTWTSVSGNVNGFYSNNNVNQVSGTTPQNALTFSFNLPPACNNQSAVFLRWVSRDISGTIGAAGRPSFAIDNITICQIATPAVSIQGPTVFCSGQTAIFQADTLNLGQTPTFQWKKNGVVTGSNIRSLSITPLIAGDQISCTVTSSLGCLTSSSANSNVRTITAVASPPSISSGVITNTACSGIKNGGVDITVSGGLSPYAIKWDTINTSNGNNFAVTVGTKFSNVLPPGIGLDFYVDGTELKELTLVKGIPYVFNVGGGHPFHIASDIVGATSQFILTNGLNPAAPVTIGTLTYTPNNFHPSLVYYPCAAHQYMGYRINLADGLATEDLTNRAPGKYSVVVTDQNGCTATNSYTILQGSTVVNATINNSTNATCYGNADGTINLNPSGGTAPYIATGTGPTFTVIKDTKNHSHPQFGTGSSFGFVIDGVQGKELTLVRGVTYAFSVLSPGHPFFISTSSVGGNSLSEVTQGVVNSMVTNGTLFFTPDASHPNLLYYQCGFHPNMGWKINIVDQLPNADLGNCMAGNYSLTVKDVNGCGSSTPLNVTITEPAANTFYYDGDHDSYGFDNEFALGCIAPSGFVSIAGDCNDQDATIFPGAVEVCNGFDDNCDGNVDEGCPVKLNLKVFIEGYYLGSGLMAAVVDPATHPSLCDTLVAELRDMNPPYGVIESSKSTINTDGNGIFTFSPSVFNNEYYIAVHHRNAIETWSKSPFALTSHNLLYEFTIDPAAAFNSNMKETFDSQGWEFYSGDINQDGAVDGSDFLELDPSIQNGDGGYMVGDLNGDGSVDGSDFLLLDPNVQAGVGAAMP